MLYLFCGICQEDTWHKFDGIQEFPRYNVELWTCTKCGGTQGRVIGKA